MKLSKKKGHPQINLFTPRVYSLNLNLTIQESFTLFKI